jgi:hypothetical protein
VNILNSGPIETDFGGGATRDSPELKKIITGLTALIRAGLPDDNGGADAALFSEDTGWMTGQRIEFSGEKML